MLAHVHMHKYILTHVFYSNTAMHKYIHKHATQTNTYIHRAHARRAHALTLGALMGIHLVRA